VFHRAPFGLFYHAAWFTQPHHKEGFIAFLDTIVEMPDVWLVTNWQAIQWVRDPTPLSRINSFPPFQCNYPVSIINIIGYTALGGPWPPPAKVASSLSGELPASFYNPVSLCLPLPCQSIYPVRIW